MFSKLSDRLTTKLYIEVCEKHLKVVNLKTGFTYKSRPLIAVDSNEKGEETILAIGDEASLYSHAINPFSHPRVILNHFKMAELLLRRAFEKATQKKIIFSPIAIIKNMRDMNTSLSDIEKMALCELCTYAGARKVIVLDKIDIDIHTASYEELKQVAFLCNGNI